MILDWYANEHLPSEDIPPRWMWHLDHEIEEWFDRVRSRHGGGPEQAMDKNEDPLVEQLRAQIGRR